MPFSLLFRSFDSFGAVPQEKAQAKAKNNIGTSTAECMERAKEQQRE